MPARKFQELLDKTSANQQGPLKLRILICRVLNDRQEMSARELVDYFLTLDWGTTPSELTLLASVLNSLREDGFIEVGFKMNFHDFDLIPVVRLSKP